MSSTTTKDNKKLELPDLNQDVDDFILDLLNQENSINSSVVEDDICNNSVSNDTNSTVASNSNQVLDHSPSNIGLTTVTTTTTITTSTLYKSSPISSPILKQSPSNNSINSSDKQQQQQQQEILKITPDQKETTIIESPSTLSPFQNYSLSSQKTEFINYKQEQQKDSIKENILDRLNQVSDIDGGQKPLSQVSKSNIINVDDDDDDNDDIKRDLRVSKTTIASYSSNQNVNISPNSNNNNNNSNISQSTSNISPSSEKYKLEHQQTESSIKKSRKINYDLITGTPIRPKKQSKGYLTPKKSSNLSDELKSNVNNNNNKNSNNSSSNKNTIQNNDNNDNNNSNNNNNDKDDGLIKQTNSTISTLVVQNNDKKVLKKNDSGEFCPICQCNFINPYISPCGHICCFECWCQWLSLKLECPVCRERARIKLIKPIEVMSSKISTSPPL
ncbi:hypothetical protein CYY_009805 [Polysphondylium violaceum]|uniref:RING-type domain-containing protein n=1 Tax=Polysphondylium violaceum TaxID=133409 RepID=A0A8J4PKK7_9MYCE|nr:hypothetical protein CYY_009805 [Polysphondylium violaceum]